MKYPRAALALLLMMLLLAVNTAALDGEQGSALDFRGVWVSTVLNLDYPTTPTADPAALKAEADAILDDIAAMGANAVILQVRPCADAFYESAIFPWSRYLTGEAGVAPEDGFDPLQYWVLEAHARGLELHAWLNPYRITKNTSADCVEALTDLPEGHPARVNPGWAIRHGSDFYFDPGLPQVRRLIVDAAVEIVKNYDVDGIHLDDYFYPGRDFADEGTYKALAPEGQSKDDWRRENVNALIRDLDEALHEADPDLSFGVSPFGIWANASTDPAGSDTRGGESYTQHYADTRLWVKEGWLDYIAPQLYWEFGHKSADYETLVDWWADTVRGTDVALCIGHAVYRIGDPAQSAAWQSPEQLTRQLRYDLTVPEVAGSIFFRHGSFTDSIRAELREVIDANAAYIADLDPAPGVHALSVAIPSEDVTTTYEAYYLGGSSDSSLPLTINGVPVYDRTPEGFWGYQLTLEPGENTVTLRQGEKTVTRTITRVDSLPESDPTGPCAIYYAYPTRDTYVDDPGPLTLSCTAPIGATVKVTVGGSTYRMTPQVRTTQARADHVLTEYTLALGAFPEGEAPVYTMTMGSRIDRVQAGTLRATPDPDGLVATVTGDAAYLYPEPTTTGGPSGELSRGMTASVTEIRGTWLKTGLGQWLRTDAVKTEQGSAALTAAAWTVEEGIERLHFPGNGSAYAVYDDAERTLHLRVSPAEKCKLTIPAGSLFASCDASAVTGRVRYSLRLRDDADLGGWWVESDDSGVTLCVRAKKQTRDLSGVTIVVDPGHGGSQTGAYGLLADYPEKRVNLETALLLRDALETLGATVLMTREDDRDVSLEARVQLSRQTKPDLFVSIHANAMASDFDCRNADGFGVWYYAPVSAEAAASVFASLCRSLDAPDVGLHQQNLHVCRTSWAPAILVEAGFMSNPGDFASLIDPASRAAFTDALAQSILDWFAR